MKTTTRTTKSTNAKTPLKATIQQATLSRVTAITGEFLGYVVRSDSDANQWYHLTWSDDQAMWHCDCPATKPCKHIKAVQELCEARVELGYGPCHADNAPVATTRRAVRMSEVYANQEHVKAAKAQATAYEAMRQGAIAATIIDDAMALTGGCVETLEEAKAALNAVPDILDIFAVTAPSSPVVEVVEEQATTKPRMSSIEAAIIEREKRATSPLRGSRAFSLMR